MTDRSNRRAGTGLNGVWDGTVATTTCRAPKNLAGLRRSRAKVFGVTSTVYNKKKAA